MLLARRRLCGAMQSPMLDASPVSAPGPVWPSRPHPEACSSLVALSLLAGANDCGAAPPCPTWKSDPGGVDRRRVRCPK
jgi:hypothetical protein